MTTKYDELVEAQRLSREQFQGERNAAREVAIALLRNLREFLTGDAGAKEVAKYFDPSKKQEDEHGFRASPPGADVNDALQTTDDGFCVGIAVLVKQPQDARPFSLGFIVQIDPVDEGDHDIRVHPSQPRIRIHAGNTTDVDRVTKAIFDAALNWFSLSDTQHQEEAQTFCLARWDIPPASGSSIGE